MAEEKQYRMLRKDGKGTPYPWTQHLAFRGDMVEVMMTANEIKGGPPKPIYNFQKTKIVPAVEAETIADQSPAEAPAAKANESGLSNAKPAVKRKKPTSRKGYVMSKGRWIKKIDPVDGEKGIKDDA